MRLNLKLLVIFLVLGLNLKLSANEISNNTLPTDPNVTHGTAEISQGANQLTIDQQTDKLITNWSEFNIGSDAKVQFNQPSSNSSALNHVNSADPSYIYGSLDANGKVILINPNGVIFSKGSRVDVGAIVASSLKLSDENFLKDNFVFEKDGIAGMVENRGTIKAFEGGTVALISSIVKNNGTIETPNGSTALLAGEKVTLNLNYNQLISYTIDSGVLNSLVENNNAIVANNGQVILSARGLDAVRKSVVNTDGIIEAKGINTEGGKIFLEGDEITVKSNSTLIATGDNGGGQILVGGSWQNSDPTIYQATTTTIEEGATLNASANNTGNGGEIVVWSDITNDQSITKVQGKLTAEGGKNSGNGGQIETSGYKLDVEGIEVSTLANDGSAGEWLLDPGAIIIRDGGSASLPGESGSSGNTIISPSTILTGLASSNVNIYTGINGSTEYDIDVENSIAYTGVNERTLTFKATGSIDAKNGLDVAITSSNAPLNLIYWADADGDGDGHAQIGKGNTTTNGGDLWIGGGDGSTTWNGHTVGDDYASTPGSQRYGVFFRAGGTINTGAGDIEISGRADGTHNYEVGVSIAERGSSIATSITSTGNIEINGSDTNSTGTIDTPIYLSSVASINGNGGSTKNITINVDSVDSDTAQFLGNITGTANVIKNGSGILTLSGTNTYTGLTTVSAGTLTLDQASSTTGTVIKDTNAVTVNGGILNLADNTETIGALTLTSGSITGNSKILTGSSYTLNPGDGVSVSIASILAGSGNLTKSAAGTATLSGANTYTGTTTISAGTLTVSGTLSDSTDVSNSGTYDVDTTDTINSLTGSGAVQIDTGVTLTTGDAGNDEISGVISGDGNLTKVGSGTLTLSGTNTFTGATTVNNGTLKVTADDALGTTAGSTTVASGATLDFAGVTYGTTESVTVNGGTISTSTGTSSFAGAITLGANSIFDVDGTQLTVSGNVTDGGNIYNIDKTGTGILVLSNTTNSYTGTTDISAGTLTVTGSLNSGTYNSNITNECALIYNSASDQTLGGVISLTGTLEKANSSTLTLSGANTYTGTTTVTAGTLEVDGTLAQTAVTVASGATYDVDATDTVLSIAGAGTIDLTDAALTAGDGNDLEFSGVFNGANTFTKVGSATLTLSGDNSSASYTGRIIIDAGTISISSDSNLGSPNTPDADRLTLQGGTLLITQTITLDTNRGITLSTDGGTINVADTKTATYDGAITGSTAFTKDGNGTLDLGGTNTYTGATNIDDGELNVTGTLSDSTAVTVASGATYDSDTTDTIGSIAGAGNIEINTATTLTVGGDNTDTTFSGVISQDGNLTKEGSGTLTLTGTNTNTGDLTVDAGGLVLDQAGTDTGTVLHNSSNLTLNAGSVTVSDTSETVDLFTYNGGSVTGQIISISGYTYYVANGLTTTIASILYGDVPLVKSGPGSLVLTATNTYTGDTTINAGTLKIDGTGSLESGNYDALIINNGTFIYSSTTDQTLAGVISGSGTVVKEENSALTLTATNTYTGLTTVSAGTLTLDQASSTTGTVIKDTNAVTVNGGILNLADNTETIGALTLTSGSITGNSKILTGSSYTLNPGDGVSVSIAPILAGSVKDRKSAAGTATLSGANTYTGTTTISTGILVLQNDVPSLTS